MDKYDRIYAKIAKTQKYHEFLIRVFNRIRSICVIGMEFTQIPSNGFKITPIFQISSHNRKVIRINGLTSTLSIQDFFKKNEIDRIIKQAIPQNKIHEYNKDSQYRQFQTFLLDKLSQVFSHTIESINKYISKLLHKVSLSGEFAAKRREFISLCSMNK